MRTSNHELKKKLIQEHECIQLSLADQKIFAETLLNPPEPNATKKTLLNVIIGKLGDLWYPLLFVCS